MSTIDYNSLLTQLKERGMHKSDLVWFAKVNSNTVRAISIGKPISMGALLRICDAMDCDVSDVMSVKRSSSQNKQEE